MLNLRNFYHKAKKLFEKGNKQSYALNELDKKLALYIDLGKGFFVEAGANDGVSQSNTIYFEKYMGWKGLLIEPIPVLAERCKANRSKCLVENCALVSSLYRGETIQMQYNNLMSIVSGVFGDEANEAQYIELGKKFLHMGDHTYKISVPARTLSSILTSHNINKVNLLSLDVEGYEAEVLGGLDFERHAPDFILIEVWHSKKDLIKSILTQAQYNEIEVLNENHMYSDILYRRK